MKNGVGKLYRVVVSYREPEYEARTGPRGAPYRWTYAVRAESEEEARRWALNEFREVSRLSSVGWWREVVAVEVGEASAESADPAQGGTAAACDAVSPAGARSRMKM